MPPSPILTTTLNRPVWERLCEELGLPVTLPVYFKPTKGKGGKYSGMYYGGSNERIDVYTGWGQYQRDRLTSAAYELGRVVLHEARHAWQYRNWTMLQRSNVVAMEEDAMAFEDELARFRQLVIIRRQFHGSGMSKLAAAQARVRRDV